MSNTVVVYKSKYGSTEKYAKWIAEALSADIFKSNQIKIDKLEKYTTIIHCGGLYVGGILGFSLIKNNYPKLHNKKLVVVAVGATQKKEDAVEEVKNKNLPDEMKNNVHFFLLRGGLNYKRMNPLDRFLMYMMYKSIKAKEPQKLDNDSKGVLATYGKVVDFTNKKAIEPIIDIVRTNF